MSATPLIEITGVRCPFCRHAFKEGDRITVVLKNTYARIAYGYAVDDKGFDRPYLGAEMAWTKEEVYHVACYGRMLAQ